MANKIDFDRLNGNLDRMARDLPRMLGVEMLNHTKQAFRAQGFTGSSFSAWQRRKTQNRADRRTNKQRAILVDSGNLRRSLRVRKATFKETAVGAYGVPYASVHNRGLNGMPKRQFVGRSKVLNKKLERIVMREFRKAFG